MQKLWKWFSGKKTIIATTFLILSTILTQIVGGIWEVDADWFTKLVLTFDAIGGLLGTLGLGHKVIKSS